MSSSSIAAASCRAVPTRDAPAAPAASSSADGLSRALQGMQLERMDEPSGGDAHGEDAGSDDTVDMAALRAQSPSSLLDLLPTELLMRIAAIDLERIGRLSERITRETTLKLVCSEWADVVTAVVESSCGLDEPRRTVVVSERDLEVIAELDGRGDLNVGGEEELRRVVIAVPGGGAYDPRTGALTSLRLYVSRAICLVELEIDLALYELSDALCDTVAASTSLRLVALLGCRGYVSVSNAMIMAMPSLRSLRIQAEYASMTASRGDAGGAAALWAVEFGLGAGAHDWLEEVLEETGWRIRSLSLDCIEYLGSYDTLLAPLCPHLRHVHVRQFECEALDFVGLDELDKLQLSCVCGGWRHLSSLLDAGAARIEIGPARAAMAVASYPTRSILVMLHRAPRAARLGFSAAMDICAQASAALYNVLNWVGPVCHRSRTTS